MSSNRSVNVLALAERTGVVTSPVVSNLNSNSGHFVVNVTALSSGQTLALEVLGVTESGAEYAIFTALPMTQEATHRTMLGPNVNCVPGITCRDFVPKSIFFRVTPSLPAQADTYSLDLELSVS